ncbi:DUF1016 N-terminal domain-containing protein [Rhodococcus aetherivorans]|uniref:DUF1016 N-terminal domain-containing protein n=1 Tax=Rhodococcus TaxID=1827 RepID=UPI000C9AD3D0|nr:hypothetical protein CQZ88_05685 [Rhodococcus sp. ENV425]
MRRFAETCPDPDTIGQRPVGQLRWVMSSSCSINSTTPGLRDWYSAEDIAHGWSRPVLAHQISTRLYLREGGPVQLPARARAHRFRARWSRSSRIRLRSSFPPLTGTPSSVTSRIGSSSASSTPWASQGPAARWWAARSTSRSRDRWACTVENTTGL